MVTKYAGRIAFLLAVAGVFLRAVNADPPAVTVFSKTRGDDFAADFHKKIRNSVFPNKGRYLINGISFGDGGQVEGYGSYFFSNSPAV